MIVPGLNESLRYSGKTVTSETPEDSALLFSRGSRCSAAFVQREAPVSTPGSPGFTWRRTVSAMPDGDPDKRRRGSAETHGNTPSDALLRAWERAEDSVIPCLGHVDHGAVKPDTGRFPSAALNGPGGSQKRGARWHPSRRKNSTSRLSSHAAGRRPAFLAPRAMTMSSPGPCRNRLRRSGRSMT